jgi:hypothetical protein
VETPDRALGVAVSGTHAYVADGGSGLQVIDITNPESPRIVGSVDTPGNAMGVAVSGTHAYVTDGNRGLQVIDITDPESPEIVGSVDTPDKARGVAASGSLACVADGLGGLQILPVQCEASGIRLEQPIISTLRLRCLPNPSRHQAVISFQLPTQGRVRATIHDVAGRQVRVLCDRSLAVGAHELPWDGRDDGGTRVAAGVYPVRVSTAVGTAIGRLLILQ